MMVSMWCRRRRVIQAREEERKTETMTAVKWVPPVGDSAKWYAPWAPGGLADGLRWWASFW
jgi:hypothetical protein